MDNEDLANERKASIAREVIRCLDQLFDLTGETILIETTHHNNPLYFTIEVKDNNSNKIGINIHKIK